MLLFISRVFNISEKTLGFDNRLGVRYSSEKTFGFGNRLGFRTPQVLNHQDTKPNHDKRS